MKSILTVCLLVWGCQGLSNDFESTNQWLETFLTTTDESPTDCYTEKQEVGQWVKLSECMDSNNIDLEKTGVYRESSSHNLKICCPRSRLITTGTEILPPMPKKKAGCGWSNPGCFPFPDSSKTRAKFGEFPWMVALMKKIAKTTRQKVPKKLRLCKFLNIDCLSVYDPDSSGCTVEAPFKNTDLSPKEDESPTDCYTEKKEVGQWVKLSECMDSNNIDLEKTGVYRESSGHNLKICCPRSRLITTGTEILPPMPKQKAGCGWSNPGCFPFPDSSKTRAKFGEFPWMVALMKKVAKTTRQKVPKELRLCKFLNIDCLSVYDPDSSGCTVEAPLKNTDLSPKEDESPTDCYTEKKEVGQWVKLSECMDSNNIDLEKTGFYRESSGHNLKICCPRSRLITTGTEIPKQKAGCGWSNPGGFPFPDSLKTHAKFGEFPWMVALMRKVAKTTRQKVPKELCKFLNIDCLSVYDPDSSGCTVEAPLKNTDLSLKKVSVSSPCLTVTGEVGQCVSYYDCYDVVQDKYDKGRKPECPHYLHVCCMDVPTGDEDLEI